MATSRGHTSKLNGKRADVGTAASILLKEGKKFANEIYEDSMHRVTDTVCQAEESFKEYSDTLTHTIKKNPVQSVLIAGGIGFLLSMIFRK